MLGAWVPQPLQAKRRQSKCQQGEHAWHETSCLLVKRGPAPLRRANRDHTQDRALAVPRELPPEVVPLAEAHLPPYLPTASFVHL